jgi:AcrR family transcriptional regulator
MKPINYYKISELSRIASIPIPTIRFYLREGLLPPPFKTGKTSAYYNDDHLDRLILIKKLQADKQRGLSSIKEELGKIPLTPQPDSESLIVSSEKRNAIIAAAINLFINKGLGDTSIDDIVNEARIGKGTFYKFFRDKNDLFVHCADSIFYEMYRHVWKEIKNEHDMAQRLIKRGRAFYQSYPKWIDMMNILRHASVSDNPFIKKKFKSVLNQIIQPIANDLEKLQNEGRISNNFDCLNAAYILMGMTEYSAWLIHNKGLDMEEILQIILNLFFIGLQKSE